MFSIWHGLPLSSVIFVIAWLQFSNCRIPEPTEEPLNPQIIIPTTTEVPQQQQAVLSKPVKKVPSLLSQSNVPECFHYPDNICINLIESAHRCKNITKTSVVCCHLNSGNLNEALSLAGVGPTAEVQSLHIINATLDVLNVSHSAWKRLHSMSVTDGSIKRVTGIFPKLSTIACLNLSNNGLLEIEKRALVNLFNLSVLDLSHNRLEALPKFDTRAVNLTLDISDNAPLQCSNLQDTMSTKRELIFRSQNATYCLSTTTFHWFNTTEKVPFSQMEHIVELSLLCPRINNVSCSCLPHRLDMVPGRPPTFAVRVDCSSRNLTQLPKALPPHTSLLNVSNNKIESLSLLSDDDDYKHIRELYADFNEITSIAMLEGTKFIDNFVVLSLRANKLRNLPTYFLSNTFDRNFNSRFVNLGLNRLTCDCNTVKVVKFWLLTKQKNIPDSHEIFCENIPDKRVMELDQSEVCQYPRDWTDYVYFVIAAEALLLVSLIGKVFYDYWVFKTTGYLPWPASHMPKLPCDWLCET